MERDQFGDVQISHSITVGEAKQLFVFHVGRYASESAARHGVFASIDECHTPGLRLALMNFHSVTHHVEGYVGHVEEVVGEVLLDHIPLVAAADHKVIHAVSGVNFHDVPQDRFAADFDHRLWL